MDRTFISYLDIIYIISFRHLITYLLRIFLLIFFKVWINEDKKELHNNTLQFLMKIHFNNVQVISMYYQ